MEGVSDFKFQGAAADLTTHNRAVKNTLGWCRSTAVPNIGAKYAGPRDCRESNAALANSGALGFAAAFYTQDKQSWQKRRRRGSGLIMPVSNLITKTDKLYN